MEQSIVFAGFGGQGVLTAGLIVANVAMQEGKEVLWMPAYGGQMRGGKSYSLVKMDDAPICHPDIEELDVLVAMNRPSLEGFSKFVKKGGLVLINSDTIGDEVPFEMEGVTSYPDSVRNDCKRRGQCERSEYRSSRLPVKTDRAV